MPVHRPAGAALRWITGWGCRQPGKGVTSALRTPGADEAIPARDKALAELAEAQAAVLMLKDAVIRRSGQDEWRALWGEVQKAREKTRAIQKARQRFVAARTVH